MAAAVAVLAGNYQRLDGVSGNQVVGNGAGALQHKPVIAFAVGGMAAVGHIDKALMGHFCVQGAQHGKAADTAVKHTDGAAVLTVSRANLTHQAVVRGMFLNAPVAIFFCHSAGPVIWALVRPRPLPP